MEYIIITANLHITIYKTKTYRKTIKHKILFILLYFFIAKPLDGYFSVTLGYQIMSSP